ATRVAGLAGTSSGTAYVESVAGIRMGGRTGLTSVVTALCFVPCFFVAPLAAAVPTYATAPVLVLVGVSMFHMVSQIDFTRTEDGLPAFVTLVLIPLTFGFILHAVLYACVGRARELPLALWLLAALSAVLLFLR
ncbi:MAG: permease, partial [Acidobacteria bacterium]